MIKISVWASGGGSNAREICKHFENHVDIQVSLIVSNKANAGVHQVAQDFGIESRTISSSELISCTDILNTLEEKQINYIILAGFLLLIPSCLIQKYQNRIINIHPSLLPKYGGAGMYGMNVHKAVKANQDLISGMTVHLVNEFYDDGEILYQASCPLSKEMCEVEIAQEVLKLEHLFYSCAIENYISSHENYLKTN